MFRSTSGEVIWDRREARIGNRTILSHRGKPHVDCVEEGHYIFLGGNDVPIHPTEELVVNNDQNLGVDCGRHRSPALTTSTTCSTVFNFLKNVMMLEF